MSTETTATCDNCGRDGAIREAAWVRPTVCTGRGEWRDLCAECLADVRARCGIR